MGGIGFAIKPQPKEDRKYDFSKDAGSEEPKRVDVIQMSDTCVRCASFVSHDTTHETDAHCLAVLSQQKQLRQGTILGGLCGR